MTNILSLDFLLPWSLLPTASHYFASLVLSFFLSFSPSPHLSLSSLSSLFFSLLFCSFYSYFNGSTVCAKWVCFSFRSQYKPSWNQGNTSTKLKKKKKGWRKEGKVDCSCLFDALWSWSFSPGMFIWWMFKLEISCLVPWKLPANPGVAVCPDSVGRRVSRSHAQVFPSLLPRVPFSQPRSVPSALLPVQPHNSELRLAICHLLSPHNLLMDKRVEWDTIRFEKSLKCGLTYKIRCSLNEGK